MKALIMILFNIKEQTWHPILYFEHPFANEIDVCRFKSKGHRTIGLKTREEALATIKPELEDRLEGYKVYKDLDNDLMWDGEDIPADNQLRDKEFLNKQ